MIDYQVVQAMAHFAMIFYGTNTWQWGGKVEVSADNATWTTLVDQTTPLGTLQIGHDVDNRPIDAAHPLAVRYVRITDYCHAGSGTGTGRLCTTSSRLPLLSAPLPRPAVHRQDARHGRYAERGHLRHGRQGNQVPRAGRPLHAGQTVDFYWDGRDQYWRGRAGRINEYEIRVLDQSG